MTARPSDWLRAAPAAATNPKAETPLFRFLMLLMRRENLSEQEAAELFRALIDTNADQAQIAGVLTALTSKGETHEELAGMASVMREASLRIKAPKNSVDMGGTGTSRSKTFNVSTAAAFVAAGAGLNIAKQS